MPDKSYVTMEQNVCAVCARQFDTGNLLLDRRLKPVFERHTTTGWGLCPECGDLKERGYVAIVEVDAEKSGFPTTLDNAYRLGRIVHLRREKAKEIQRDLADDCPLMFAQPQMIDWLVELASRAEAPNAAS